jgi:hypothetical protein
MANAWGSRSVIGIYDFTFGTPVSMGRVIKVGYGFGKQIIADSLKKRGWSLGWVSAIDSEGRTIWIANAHRGDLGQAQTRCHQRYFNYHESVPFNHFRLRHFGYDCSGGPCPHSEERGEEHCQDSQERRTQHCKGHKKSRAHCSRNAAYAVGRGNSYCSLNLLTRFDHVASSIVNANHGIM